MKYLAFQNLLVPANTQYGLLGAHITHSLSPRIHNYALKRFQIDGSYQIFDLKSSADIPSFLEWFFAKGGQGLNITSPYKSLVAKYVRSPLPAVNTLSRSPDGWRSTCTDGLGFVASIKSFTRTMSDFNRLIFVGCGGVVRSIIYYLAKEFTPSQFEIYILRRNAENDQRIRGLCTFPVYFLPFSFDISTLAHDLSQALVIQATNVPHHSHALARMCSQLQNFPGYIMDLTYNAPYPFIPAIPPSRLADGIPMLIEQARAAQYFWWRKSLSYQDIAAIIHPQR